MIFYFFTAPFDLHFYFKQKIELKFFNTKKEYQFYSSYRCSSTLHH